MTVAPPAFSGPLMAARPAGQPAPVEQGEQNEQGEKGTEKTALESRGAAGSGVVGVVLAGGLSSRLGTDKARLRLLPLQPPRTERATDSVPARAAPPAPLEQDLLTRTIDLLRACTDDVAVSCRASGQSSRDVRPWRHIPDEEEGNGPVGALCSILRAEPRPVLVLPCDLPFMTEQVLRRLLAARAARPPDAVMTVFRQRETGRLEPLVAIYEPACRPWFEAALTTGERRLGAVVPERLRVCIPYTEAEALPFFNLNTPADLDVARRLAAWRTCGAARV